MNRHFSAAGAAGFLLINLCSAAHAADRPLIWQPVKNSDTSYSVKLGMKLPTRLEPQAGFDVGVNTTKGGGVVDTPLRFWTSIKAADAKRPAYQMSRDIGVNVDGMAGSAAISMNYYEKHIATPSLNVERQASYVVHYDGVQESWTGLDANQSIKLRRHETGTAFTASASSLANFSTYGAGVGIEQQLGKNITVSGTVNRSFSAAETVASVNASYSYKW